MDGSFGDAAAGTRTGAEPRLLLRRDELLAGLFILTFANGIADRIFGAVAINGLWAEILNTFEISALVWLAAGLVLFFLSRQPTEAPTRVDLAVGLGLLVVAAVPYSLVSWVALTLLGAFVLRTAPAGSPRRQAAVIMLAITVPMFWSRVVFSLFSDVILQVDAVLASWITGTDRVGNTVRLAGHSGYLYIGPACSSLANVSLAILGWFLLNQGFARRPPLRQVGWCLLACAAVVVINVARIGLIGLHREQYELLHGPVGATVASWLTLAAIVGINGWGIRRNGFARS